MSDFSYNGVKASSLGLVVQSKNRPILPQLRQRFETVVGRDGTLDFSDNTLEDRIISVNCSFFTGHVGDLRYRARQIASFLYGGDGKSKRLIFDDEPDVFYWAKVTNQIDLEQTVTYGEFSIVFRCEPFAYSVDLAHDAYDMGAFGANSPVIMYRDLQAEDLYDFTFISGGDSHQFSVNNFGTAKVRPLIEVYNPLKQDIELFSITEGISIGDNAPLVVNGWATKNVTTLYIDLDKYMAYSLSGGLGSAKVNRTDMLSGRFISLLAGDNTIRVDGSTNITLRFRFNARFL